MKLTIDDVKTRFIKHLGGEHGSIYASPGRINLIGEHTDYNGGFVFPGAVTQGMIAEIRPNGTRTIRAYSIDLKDYDEFSIDDEKGPNASHFRYIFGVVREMMALGVPVEGFDTAFAGDVPNGAGMSSSAALESCYAFAINDLFGDNKIDKMTLAKVGQATEHKYIGVNCGIMDQFASVHGKKGNLMRLDCRSGEFEYFPWNPQGYKLVLINSCVKHELVGSPYNDRRNSCENVVKHIAAKHPERQIETLRDCTWEDLEEVKNEVEDELKRNFRPEFINRVDDIVVFSPLTEEQIGNIIELQLESLRKRLAEKEISLELTPKAKAFMAKEAYEPAYGARPVKRYLQKNVETALATKIIAGEIAEGDTVLVDTDGDSLKIARK